jgi:ferric-dicitrate binding protein FerR (iron transport regulator)
MMDRTLLDALLVRYADGKLDEAGLDVLHRELTENPDASEQLRFIAEQAFALGESRRLQPVSAVQLAATEIGAPARRGFPRWLAGAAAAASAAAAVAVCSLLFFRSAGVADLLIVEEASGAVEWLGTDGARRTLFSAEMALPPGTLDLATDTAMAKVRFADGTRIVLSGPAEVEFGEQQGKRVRVRHGKLNAEVSKQPAGQPMQVLTPTADLLVVGTAFSVDVQARTTGLNVTEGLVRMRRLADGTEAEVRPGQRLVCSLDPSVKLVPHFAVPASPRWTADFSTQPERLNGVWIVPSPEYPKGALGSQPLVAKKFPDGRVTIHHGIILESSTGLALLVPESIIRLRLRTKQDAALQLIVGLHRGRGEYAGNFELSPIPCRASEDGKWQDFSFPLSKFLFTQPKFPALPAESTLAKIILTTFQADAGLELLEMEISRL